jgi:LysM repeat protein
VTSPDRGDAPPTDPFFLRGSDAGSPRGSDEVADPVEPPTAVPPPEGTDGRAIPLGPAIDGVVAAHAPDAQDQEAMAAEAMPDVAELDDDAPVEGIADDSGQDGPACPYLAAAGGGWRALEATRDHRCAALDPPAAVALDKQRRLCLAGAHVRCPTFIAAREARDAVLASVPEGWAPERRFVRTTPVVVEAGPRRTARSASLGRGRLVEVAVAVLALVVVVLVGSRILGGESPAGTPGTSPAASGIAGAGSPGATAPVGASTVPGSDVPDATPGASSPEGSAAPSVGASTSPDGSAAQSPSASPAKKTYHVKKGDTLSAIAAKYGVTVSQIVKANRIKDASTIHVGQVLVIPPPAP